MSSQKRHKVSYNINISTNANPSNCLAWRRGPKIFHPSNIPRVCEKVRCPLRMGDPSPIGCVVLFCSPAAFPSQRYSTFLSFSHCLISLSLSLALHLSKHLFLPVILPERMILCLSLSLSCYLFRCYPWPVRKLFTPRETQLPRSSKLSPILHKTVFFWSTQAHTPNIMLSIFVSFIRPHTTEYVAAHMSLHCHCLPLNIDTSGGFLEGQMQV